jgi:hypothetical protein
VKAKAAAVLALASVIAALTWAVALVDRDSDPGWIGPEEAAAEYLDESGKLKLAPGWSWPTPEYSERDSGGNLLRYGEGIGRVDAAWYWHCSWASTYLDATDPATRGAALSQVLRLRESAFYSIGLLPGDREARDKILDAASQGRDAELRNIVELNCPNNA